MKSSTGTRCYFENTANADDTDHPVTLPVVLANSNGTKFRVKLVMSDWEIMDLLHEFLRIAKSRAKAHDEMASRLRAAAGAE